MTDGYLNTIEGMEQRLQAIIDFVIIECSDIDPATGALEATVGVVEAIEYEEEIWEILDRYLEFRPSNHPDYLGGNLKYALKLEAILLYLDSQCRECENNMRQMLENLYCPNKKDPQGSFLFIDF